MEVAAAEVVEVEVEVEAQRQLALVQGPLGDEVAQAEEEGEEETEIRS